VARIGEYEPASENMEKCVVRKVMLRRGGLLQP